MGNDAKQYRRPESILVVVYTHQGDVLLLRRAGLNPYWQSITGSLEQGEAQQQAAERELYEETGLQGVAIIDCQQAFDFEIYPERLCEYVPGTTLNRESVFRVELESRCEICLNSSEHTEYEWLPFSGALARVHSATNRDALLAVMSYLAAELGQDKTK